MSAALPSPPASPRGHPLPLGALQDDLGGLLREREELRKAGISAELERNRQAIVALQQQIARALIAQYATA